MYISTKTLVTVLLGVVAVAAEKGDGEGNGNGKSDNAKEGNRQSLKAGNSTEAVSSGGVSAAVEPNSAAVGAATGLQALPGIQTNVGALQPLPGLQTGQVGQLQPLPGLATDSVS